MHKLFSMIFLLLLTIFIVGCEGNQNVPIVSDSKNVQPPTTPTPSTPTVSTPTVPETESNTVTTQTTVAPVPCTDTDGGQTYNLKGTLTVTNADGTTATYTDYCRHGQYEDYVFEYFCGETGMMSKSYKCIKGCNNNGACW